MSQLPELDMSFAPLGAELDMEMAQQHQQFESMIDEAISMVEQPMGVVDEFPTMYDEKLRQLIDAVPME